MYPIRRWLTQLSACFLFLAVGFTACLDVAADESGSRQELARVAMANQAVQSLVSAKLDLERFHLHQRAQLLQHGHASWLEVARQQVLVDSLTDQLRSLKRFSQWVEQLSAELQTEWCARTSNDRGADAPAVAVFRPGSMRLVGWFEQSPASQFELEPNAAPELEQESLVESARRTCQRKQARYRQLLAAKNIHSQSQELARLQVAYAKARLELLELQQTDEFREFRSPVSTRLPLKLSRFDVVPRTINQSDALRIATHRIALVEAHAAGMRDAAAIRVIQAQDKLDAVRKRNAQGYLPSSAVEQTAGELANAVARQQQFDAQLADLVGHLEKISGDQQPMETSTFFHWQLSRHSDWPRSALQHSSRLSYLIDLRRRYFHLEGQCNAHHHQLRFRREQLARLKQAAPLEPANPGDKALAAHRLQQSLASGRRCEIQQLSREIEYLEKSAAGIGQQMAITALEEHRFIVQLEQVRLMPLSRLTDLLRPAAMAVAVLHQSSQAHHFLATDVDIDESELVMVRYCPQYFAFGDFVLETEKATNSYFDRWLPLSFERNRKPATKDRHAPYSCRTKDRDIDTSTPAITARGRDARDRYRLGPSSSHVIYPFGILRSDLRHRLPAGSTPWYLPGSPTNLQRK